MWERVLEVFDTEFADQSLQFSPSVPLTSLGEVEAAKLLRTTARAFFRALHGVRAAQEELKQLNKEIAASRQYFLGAINSLSARLPAVEMDVEDEGFLADTDTEDLARASNRRSTPELPRNQHEAAVDKCGIVAHGRVATLRS